MRRTAGVGSAPARDGALRAAQLVSLRAFTLVELLVALVLAGVVLGAMVSFFVTHVRASRVGGVRIEAVQRARFAAELLRREISLAGSGIPNAQPMIVYAGPNDLLFSADLTSSTVGDRVAVYQLPGAPMEETLGADSAAMTLPNGQVYPQTSYGPNGLAGPAETIQFSFVAQGDGHYTLTRSVNGRQAEVLLAGLMKVENREFFSYEVTDPDEGLRSIGSTEIWHQAPIHGSAADTGVSALTDSVKLVHVAFKMLVKGRRGDESVERNFSMAIPVKNAGLIHNLSCGDPPELGVIPSAAVVGLDPARVRITWLPAIDEREGEQDVFQYTLYRREGTVVRPIASIPPNAEVTSYSHEDLDVEPGKSYTYLLGATDCTPTQSELAASAPVDIPAS